MNIQVWPFLVTRNKTHEYMTVVSPKFLYDDHTAGFLSAAASGDVSDPGWVASREIQGLSGGSITMIFRIVLARERYLGLETDELLYDQHHRPINLIEGIVLEGREQTICLTDEAFNTIHRHMQDVYRLFWQNVSDDPKEHPFQQITLKIEEDEKKYLRVRRLPAFKAVITMPAKNEMKVPETFLSPQQNSTESNQELVLWVGGIAAAGALLVGYLLSRGR